MSSLSENVWQVLRQSEENENSIKYDQILIRSGDPLLVFQQVCPKCMESVRPIKGQDRMENQWSVTKSKSGLWNP